MTTLSEPTQAELDAIEARKCADPLTGWLARMRFALYRADFAGAAQAYFDGHPGCTGDVVTLAKKLKAQQVRPFPREWAYPSGTFHR